MYFNVVSLGYEEFSQATFKPFQHKEKAIHTTISELKAFNICEEKIEKERRFRAYISEINQRYNKIRKRERNSLRKAS